MHTMTALLSVDLSAAAERIKLRLDRSAEDVVEIGRELLAVRDTLEEGHFVAWIDTEFGMSRATAYRFINVAERFGGDFSRLRNVSAAVLYELSAPSTPETVVETVVARTAKGETVTGTETRRLKREAREAAERLAESEHERNVLVQQVSDLSGQLEKTASVSEPDHEPWKRALATFWRSAPMPVREWFYQEFPNAYCAPHSERAKDFVADSIDGAAIACASPPPSDGANLSDGEDIRFGDQAGRGGTGARNARGRNAAHDGHAGGGSQVRAGSALSTGADRQESDSDADRFARPKYRRQPPPDCPKIPRSLLRDPNNPMAELP